MHLIFENIIPMMVHLWKGEFREVETRNQPYVISRQDWDEIGRLTVESNPLVPSFFVRPIPNIHTDQHLFTAEAYSFWFLHMAPTLLRNRFPEARYYDHAILLIQIVQKCIQYEITEVELKELERRIVIWVEKFERYYYQYDINMVQVCTLPIHALLHVPYDIRATGPVSVCWSWVMERFCGFLGIAVKNGRRFPNATLAYQVHAHALVNYFEACYELGLRLLYPDLRLAIRTTRFIPDPTTRTRIARYFPVLVDQRIARKYKIKVKTFENLLPESMVKYHKLEILNGGDTIRARDSTLIRGVKDERGNSFIRYTLFPDRNANDANAEDDPVPQIMYGRLLYIVVFDLPVVRNAGQQFSQPTTYRLACVRACKLRQAGDATAELVEFAEMEDTPTFIHVGVIECTIGRVRTPTGWSIVDRSSEWARTVFTSDEIDSRDDEN
ncbi:hypothetical protein CPB86DRAFT_718977 [Serendipita vermifera]|nr:hypothetical protein CPB86DRAFT_718977 [Serendipita vermifera]